jgi:hypothetical protein
MTDVAESVPSGTLDNESAHPEPDDSSKAMSMRRPVVLSLCVVAVLGVYIRSATSYDKSLTSPPSTDSFQTLLADAFLHGQFDLRVDVPRGMAALPDPYDPVANSSYRLDGLHDLAYYDGKLYTYNGPTPVLLLDIPYRLFFRAELSSTLACLVFIAGGFLASVRAFQRTASHFLGPITLPIEATAVVALGLAGPMAWIIHIGRGYEVSIAAGYFMVAVGLLFMSRGLFSATKHPVIDLALMGTFFAGSVGARPSLLWAVFFLAFAFAFVRWGQPERPIVQRTAALAIVVPPVLIGTGLAWYNWARFGSVGEFGTSYMLLGENVRLALADQLVFLRRGTFQYVFSPPRLETDFPWLRLRLSSQPVPTEYNYLLEPVAGLLPTMPAAVLGVIAYVVAPWSRLRERWWLTLLVVSAGLISVLIFAVVSYRIHGATMRYLLDFTAPLLFASVLGGSAWVMRVRTPTLRAFAGGAAIIAVAWSAFFVMNVTSYPCAGTGSC